MFNRCRRRAHTLSHGLTSLLPWPTDITSADFAQKYPFATAANPALLHSGWAGGSAELGAGTQGLKPYRQIPCGASLTPEDALSDLI